MLAAGRDAPAPALRRKSHASWAIAPKKAWRAEANAADGAD